MGIYVAYYLLQMGKLGRYIFYQVAGAAFMTVALFVFVLVLGNIFKSVIDELISGRIDFAVFVKVVSLIIPAVIPYSLPMGMLTGILLVFGRMSAQSEIVAMKACGRSIYSMIAPVFLLAIIASGISLYINFYYAPKASYEYKNAIKNVIRKNPIQFIQAGKFVKDFPGYVIYANGTETSANILNGFSLWQLNNKNEVVASFKSDKATVSYNSKTDEIIFVLENVHIPRSKNEFMSCEKIDVKIPLSEAFGESRNEVKKPKRMTFDELWQARHTWHKIPLEKLPPEQRAERIARDRIEINLQIQKNIAMAFSIFSLVVLAVPLGIKASRSETFVNLAIAISLAMTYYMMTVFISWLEKYPDVRPDILIWLPNFIFQGVGMYLIIRASKH